MDDPRLLFKQKIRFTFDVEVSISDYAKALLDAKEIPDDYKGWAEQNPEEFRSDVDFQRRLVYSLINMPDVLLKFVLESAWGALSNYCQQNDVALTEPLETFLAPVANIMDEDDKQHFQDAVQKDYLTDITKIATYDSFRSKVVKSKTEALDPEIKSIDLTK